MSDSFRYPLVESLEWDKSRHRRVAELAEKNMQSGNAKQAVAGLLSHLNESNLPAIASWADAVKDFPKPKPGDHPETKAFLTDARNANNREWHFVNLPLGATGYDPIAYSYFTRVDDVVQVADICVSVLAESSDRFSKPNALRLLVHLVSDLHQPLHVGCSYISKANGSFPFLVTDPEIAAHEKLESDRGGNWLILPTGEAKPPNLHGFWDSGFFSIIEGSEDTTNPPKTPDIQDRDRHEELRNVDPRLSKWATESLVAARSAYQSIIIKERLSKTSYLVSWEGKEKYVARNKPVLENQLRQAGLNLALLLDSLWP